MAQGLEFIFANLFLDKGSQESLSEAAATPPPPLPVHLVNFREGGSKKSLAEYGVEVGRVDKHRGNC